MDKLYDIKEKLCEELEEYARKQELGAGDLEVLHKLTDTIKNIDKIAMLEGEEGYPAMRRLHGALGLYARAGGSKAT